MSDSKAQRGTTDQPEEFIETQKEVWFQWKEMIEGRMINVQADPMIYENSLGELLFESSNDAKEYIVENEIEREEGWFIVRVTFERMI